MAGANYRVLIRNAKNKGFDFQRNKHKPCPKKSCKEHTMMFKHYPSERYVLACPCGYRAFYDPTTEKRTVVKRGKR